MDELKEVCEVFSYEEFAVELREVDAGKSFEKLIINFELCAGCFDNCCI